MGPKQARRLYRALPVFAYFLQQSRSERNSTAPFSLSCTSRQFSGRMCGCVLVFIITLSVCIA